MSNFILKDVRTTYQDDAHINKKESSNNECAASESSISKKYAVVPFVIDRLQRAGAIGQKSA